jgi:hypothetical protein
MWKMNLIFFHIVYLREAFARTQRRKPRVAFNKKTATIKAVDGPLARLDQRNSRCDGMADCGGSLRLDRRFWLWPKHIDTSIAPTVVRALVFHETARWQDVRLQIR